MIKKLPHSATQSLVIGCILAWLRQQAGLDQRQMAHFLGITQASWSRIENGHATANIEQILNSCAAMRIDFVYVAQLYTYICRQLEKIDIAVTSDADDQSPEVRKIVKQTISAHALSVSNKALNTDA
nr:helix-turn-helix transcriptional regulator [Alcanivorax sp. NBRC 101098]